ncbi:Cell fusion protein [Trichinella spiralis]|uniref:Cell fusion protein n=1 Tax=Trichinella spiralis TaxID=6334 RepID=A0ABR3K309_TRISP
MNETVRRNLAMNLLAHGCSDFYHHHQQLQLSSRWRNLNSSHGWHESFHFSNVLTTFLSSSSAQLLFIIIIIISSCCKLQIPQCSRTSLVTGVMRSVNLDTTEMTMTTTMQTQIGLHETGCFFVNLHPDNRLSLNDTVEESILTSNTSLLHTLRYESTHQLYPVRQQYIFAIPEIDSDCICDCPGGDDHCAVDYAYKNCTGDNHSAFCVHTYHPHQSAAGCQLAGEADICCKLVVKPYQNRRYVAVQIGQPLTVATFHYQLYSKQHYDQWQMLHDQRFQAVSGQSQRVQLDQAGLQLQLGDLKPIWQLKEGMYVFDLNDENFTLRHGVPINRFHEYSGHKLGWLRWQSADKRWTVRNGRIKLQAAHFVQTVNCLAQEYAETYNADFYVPSKENGQKPFFLGHPVEQTERWIRTVKLVDRSSTSRQIQVEQNQSPPISILLSFNSTVGMTVLYHGSELGEFVATIHLDAHSNRFINITAMNCKGTLIGQLYRSNRQETTELVFSSYVGGEDRLQNSTIRIGAPATVNGSRWLCLQPYEKPKLQKCRWATFSAQPLPKVELPHRWTQAQGHCTDGVNGWSEAMAVGLEVAFYLLLAVILCAVCRRLICPVLRWTICGNGRTNANKL